MKFPGAALFYEDEDLFTALDAGRLGGAVLDVIRQAPLPPNHQFWLHPIVLVTSHGASAIEPSIGGEIVARNLLTIAAGELVPALIDKSLGY